MYSRRAHMFLLVSALMLSMLYAAEGVPERSEELAEVPYSDPPQGYIHRPVLEFFTGLSCPSCMGADPGADSPDKAVHDAYLDSLEEESTPHTTVVFHELNGGGVDDLNTDEATERMRHYQPGVSGTPDVEIDGGYIELGGFSTSQTPITETNVKSAVAKSSQRYDDKPLRPLERLGWSFPYIWLEVDQIFDGDGFYVEVKMRYDGNAKLVTTPALRGSLFIFMVEDSVTAFSKVYDMDVSCDAVFRDYALKGQEVTMGNREEKIVTAQWEIPDAKVPIKPQDVYAVAALYDLGDTTSGDESEANIRANSPRCVQSATYRSTAYDRGNQRLPTIKEPRMENGRLMVEMDDDGGISRAFAFYNEEAANSTGWTSVELTLSGGELCDEETGVCYAYDDAVGTANITTSSDTIFVQVLAYDDQFAQASSSIFVVKDPGASSSGDAISPVSASTMMIVAGLALMILGPVLYFGSKRRESPFARFMSRKATLVIFLTAGLLISMLAIGTMVRSSTDTVPGFQVTDTEGRVHTPEVYEGKVLVMDIISTSCDPCNKEMPDLVALYKDVKEEYGGGVEFLSVSIDEHDTDRLLDDFQGQYGATWSIGRNPSFITTFDASLTPKLVIIAPNGDITYTHTGKIDRDVVWDEIKEANDGTYDTVSIMTSSADLIALAALAMVFGAITFFSPCSFPLLPTYVTYYITSDMKGEGKKKRDPLKAGMIASFGITSFFLIVGISVVLFKAIFDVAIQEYLAYLMPVVGALLLIFGASILFGFDSVFEHLIEYVKMPFKRIGSMFGKDKGTQAGSGGLFAYGFGYGAAASSCMAPVFLGVMFLAFSAGGFLGSALIISLYSLSIGAMMVIITYMVSSSGKTLERLVRNTDRIKRISGFLLLLAGAFVVFYYFWGSSFLSFDLLG